MQFSKIIKLKPFFCLILACSRCVNISLQRFLLIALLFPFDIDVWWNSNWPGLVGEQNRTLVKQSKIVNRANSYSPSSVSNPTINGSPAANKVFVFQLSFPMLSPCACTT